MMLRRLLLAVILALVPTLASAQFATIAPTPPANDNGDRIATTAWVQSNGSAPPLPNGTIFIGNASNVATSQTLSGDATLATGGALTLATVNSNIGAFGSATQCVTVTNNAKGLTTAVSATTCTPAIGSITGLGTGVTTALGVNVGTVGAVVVNGGALGTPSSGILTSATGLPLSTGVTGTLQAAQEPAHTGDVTNSAGSLALTLATVNSNVGSFGSATQCVSFTTNAKGLITAASAVTCTPAIASVTGLGTGIATALAVNVGTAGAPVINGGALGTPSSGTLTNATGLPPAGLTTGTQDTILGYWTSTTAGTTAVPNCTGALTYSTSTHTIGCNTSAGTGTVTSVATAGLASGGTITTSGTITVTAASKSDQQAGSSAVLAVTPSQQQSHDSAIKAWAYCTNSTGTYTLAASYNISGSTCGKTATGDLTLTLVTAFASVNYACVVSINDTFAEAATVTTVSTTQFRVQLYSIGTTPAKIDDHFSVQCVGRQ